MIKLFRVPTSERFWVSSSPARCFICTFVCWIDDFIFLLSNRSVLLTVSCRVDWLRLVGWEKWKFFTLSMALYFFKQLSWVRGQDSIAVSCRRPRISIVKVAYKANWDLIRDDWINQDFYREWKLTWRALVLFWNRYRINIAQVAFKHHSYEEGDIE